MFGIKKELKIIQYKDGTYGAKRRGLFGWKYLIEIYDGNWSWHFRWLYKRVPDGIGIYDKFVSKKECIKELSRYYHGGRKLKERKHMKKALGLVLLALLLAGCVTIGGCKNLGHSVKHLKSGTIGLKRVATVYAQDGTIIKQYKDRMKVSADDGLIRFICDGKSVIMSGTVIVEEVREFE